MLKIALTGNIGSGKSVVSHLFETLQVPVYHSDDAAKLFLEINENKTSLENLFGKDIFDQTGKADRKKIAAIVFSDNEKLAKLNNIIHPSVINDFDAWVVQQGSAPYVIMESAILFETGYANMFDKTIVVMAPERIRIARVVKRDSTSEELVRIRMQNQIPETEKIAKADFIIINDNQQLVIPQVLNIHHSLSALSIQ